MKPGNGRPIQSPLVIVLRVASPIAASPSASAATRIALDARGVVGKLSAMAAPRARECSVRGRAGANAGGVYRVGGVEARAGERGATAPARAGSAQRAAAAQADTNRSPR